MTDFYRDSDERMHNDADFHAAVTMLESMARRHGFTPGELKQIAFKAALNIEMTINRSIFQVCARCRSPVNKIDSYMLQGRHYCCRDCWSADGGKP